MSDDPKDREIESLNPELSSEDLDSVSGGIEYAPAGWTCEGTFRCTGTFTCGSFSGLASGGSES